MLPGKGKVPADTKAIAAAIQGGDVTIQRHWKNRVNIDRPQTEIAGKTERPPTRQQEAVPRL